MEKAAKAPTIVGLGITEVGKVYGVSAAQFAADAVTRALQDAGLGKADIDGLIVSGGLGSGVTVNLQDRLGLGELRLLQYLQAYGSTALQAVQVASLAVQSGLATTVAVVWADDPLKPRTGAGQAYADHARAAQSGWSALSRTGGALTPNNLYALAARRHMDRFGTTSEQLGSIAVAQRAWAALNPRAQMREPITLTDHQESRMVSDPLRLLDCCLVSNGGAAVIVTTAERAAALAQPPVSVIGWGQSHPGRNGHRNDDFGIVTGATHSGRQAFEMAGITVNDVDIAELYDCYTFTALVSLEDYGYCAKGEGGQFVAQPGVLGPGGTLRLNTGGGQLSSYYLWGMTPLTEAIIQARGQAGERQVDRHDTVLVSGNGGILGYHSTAILQRAA